MANLIQELVSVLVEENQIYEQLLIVSRNKTKVIVAGDLAALQDITEQEHTYVNLINSWEKKRTVAVADIAMVLGKDAKTITVAEIIELLEKQPEDQNDLAKVQVVFKEHLNQLVDINAHNQRLIEQSLEFIQFQMNLMQNANRAPVTANYNKVANNTGSQAEGRGMFDTKQ